MGDAEVTTTAWRLVEVGRVVLFSKAEKSVIRHETRLSEVSLTSIVIPKLPRAVRNSVLRKEWEKAEVEKQWENSAWAKHKAKERRRRQLTDFERFKVMRLRKQVS